MEHKIYQTTWTTDTTWLARTPRERRRKTNQWITILGSIFKVLAEIFSRLKLPEAEGKIKREKVEHPLVPKPAENKYL